MNQHGQLFTREKYEEVKREKNITMISVCFFSIRFFFLVSKYFCNPSTCCTCHCQNCRPTLHLLLDAVTQIPVCTLVHVHY